MSSRAPRSSARGRRIWALVGVLLFVSSATASACPLCYEAAKQSMTIGLKLDMSEDAVLAVALPDGSRYHVVAVIKGNDVGDIPADKVDATDAGTTPSAGTVLLLRHAISTDWTSVGAIGVEYASWLRQLIATVAVEGKRPRPTWPLALQTSFNLSEAGWRQRIALILPYLEDVNPLAAEIAWGELARAPYAALDVVRSHIDLHRISGWLDDPRLAHRHAAYTLLLGFAGGAVDASRLEQRIDGARATHDSTNLSALLAADLELRGPSRIAWIEASYFADQTRTLPEIEAALLALNVLGDADQTVPREEVIAAYQVFIGERPPMAGFVAQQLADWGYWGSDTAYIELLKSNTIKDPGSQFAVVSYLQRAASAKASVK